MTTRTAMRPISINDAPIASVRRGACPSLATPMQTGDGLLIRMRPESSGLTPLELIGIARAARQFGNGILEVTARGNLQVRGLRPETVGGFSGAIAALDIDLATGVAIETPPLAGLDPDEMVDPRGLARRLRAAIADAGDMLVLAPKLSIIIDAGGRFHLREGVADIRLSAARAEDGRILWEMTVAGDASEAKPVAVLSDSGACDAVLTVLAALSKIGPAARGRDLDVVALQNLLPHDPAMLFANAADVAPNPADLHALGSATVLGVVLPFCQIDAEALIAFLERAETLRARDVRLAPGHGVFVTGLDAEAALDLQGFAATQGLRISAGDPGNHVALCAGAKGCASAFYDTHALAGAIIERASALLDGSMTVHLSGCPKGCAHPSAAALTVAGAPMGYGLVVNGPASASPDAYIAAKDVVAALAGVAGLVRDNKTADETARSCLIRLGRDRVTDAMRQG